eukprot:COSAG01_NODE_30487_length_615_cov_0.755814_2_plen_24_part_01
MESLRGSYVRRRDVIARLRDWQAA